VGAVLIPRHDDHAAALYALLRGHRLSRKIERAATRSAFSVLTGNQQPDHTRIS